MKRIGILGGISHYTTIEYYNRLMDLYKIQSGNIDYPEIVIYSLSHGLIKKYEDNQQIDNYVDYISQGIEGLINSGAEVIALAANSPHRIFEILQNRFEIKIVSAIESTLRESQRLNIKKGLLLGIKFTMQSTFYQDRFKQAGIDLITPNVHEQDIVNTIIFNKLINGQQIDLDSKNEILEVISNYSVDGIILGCMRLPVFFNAQTVTGLNLVNTLDKHIEAILEEAKR
jgi:aspartate racemase